VFQDMKPDGDRIPASAASVVQIFGATLSE
jgi:hypothetical protein